MSYNNIFLEKAMYCQNGKTFSQVLEALDPSESYKGTELEGTDAFERQLFRFGIKVRGANPDTVDKFFSRLDSAILFPEFIARAVRRGMAQDVVLPEIVAKVTSIDQTEYSSLYISGSDTDAELADLAFGSEIPAATVQIKKKAVTLKKRGRVLQEDYETMRTTKLSALSLELERIGYGIQKSRVAEAVDVILNGDGNNNSATEYNIGTDPISGTSGTLTYAQLVEFYTQLAPYDTNAMLVNASVLAQILKLSEVKNPFAEFGAHGESILRTPLGARLLCTGAIVDDCMIALDKRCALELVQLGDVCVDYDKLIAKQLDNITITTVSGFSKIEQDASAVLYI